MNIKQKSIERINVKERIHVVKSICLGWDDVVGVFKNSDTSYDELLKMFPEDEYIILERLFSTISEFED